MSDEMARNEFLALVLSLGPARTTTYLTDPRYHAALERTWNLLAMPPAAFIEAWDSILHWAEGGTS